MDHREHIQNLLIKRRRLQQTVHWEHPAFIKDHPLLRKLQKRANLKSGISKSVNQLSVPRE